jgi:hypothetical protein
MKFRPPPLRYAQGQGDNAFGNMHLLPLTFYLLLFSYDLSDS